MWRSAGRRGAVRVEREEYHRMFELEDHYWWFRAKRALVRSLLRRYTSLPPGLALDVGCGTGGALQAFSVLGGRWVGTDRSELALAFCQKRGLSRLLQASGEALPFRSESVDLLLCLDVLYHRGIQDDRAVIAECYRVLRSGGTAIITDSALDWLRGPHDEWVHTRKRYSLGELVALVEGGRFQVLKRSYANFLLFLPTAAYRLGRKVFPAKRSRSDLLAIPRPLQRLLAAVMSAERWLLSRMDLPVGTSVVIVARKP
jgi:ubiquinone/menaquinone biosynthesis C-methylase UbiE